MTSKKQHWVAFLTMLLIGPVTVTAGAWIAIKIVAAVSGHDWTQAALPGGVLSWVSVASVLVAVIGATFLAIYVWLRLLKGRIDPVIVYHWLTLGPQPPVLSGLARRMYVSVFGPPPTAPSN